MSRIERVEAFRVSSPIRPPRASAGWVLDETSQIVVRITDSDGARGYGECVPIHGALGQLHEFAALLLGNDPLQRESLLGGKRSWLTSSFIRSAFSIALDDLAARRLGVPIHALYGGRWRDRVQPYAASYGSVVGRQLESWLDEARSLYERGFRAMKLRLGVEPVELEAANCEALRSEVPDDLELMGDGNGGFGPTNARAMGRALDDIGFVWFEEPLPPADGYVGYPELAAELEIPLAGGEVTQRRPDAMTLLRSHSVDIVQPDPVICGGIGEALFIGALARLHAVLCVPHTSGGQIGVAAGLQAIAALPDQSAFDGNTLLYLEFPALELSGSLAIVAQPLALDGDGFIRVPDGPGLGIEIDDAALERTAVDRFDAR